MKNSLILVFIFIATFSVAQQQPFYTHHVVNPYFINPAFAGSNGTNVYLDYRKQWVGIQGAPEYQLLTFETPLKQKNMGIGLTISNDQHNILGSTSGMFSYSYLAKISDAQQVRLGTSIGIRQNRILFDRLQAEDMSESSLFLSNQNGTNFDANFGVNYELKKFQLGATVSQLLGSSYNYQNSYNQDDLSFSLIKHYMIVAKYEFTLIPDKLNLSPIILGRSAQGVPFQFDGNLKFDYKDFAWLNLAYKHQVGYSFAIGTVLENNLTIGYSYEMSSNELVNHNSGTHEVIFGFKFNKSNGKGAGGLSNKELKKLEGQNNELLEKTDYLEKNNEKMRDKIEEQEKLLHQYIDGLDEIKKASELDKIALEELMKKSQVIVNNNRLENNNVNEIESLDENKDIYAVVGAFKVLSNSKTFQQIIKREYNLDSRVIQNAKESWYLVYTKKSNDKKELNQEINRLMKIDKKSIFIGNPWVYKP